MGLYFEHHFCLELLLLLKLHVSHSIILSLDLELLQVELDIVDSLFYFLQLFATEIVIVVGKQGEGI